MASLIESKSGDWKIQFTETVPVSPECPTGKRRRTIRLGNVEGKAEKAEARAFAECVEALIEIKGGKTVGPSVAASLAAWEAGLSAEMHDRLAAVELLTPRAEAKPITVGGLIERFEEYAKARSKPQTWLAYKQGSDSILAHFKAGKLLAKVTFADAEEWYSAQLKKGLAKATLSKRVKISSMIFGRAVKWGLIQTNPFGEIKAGSQVNRERSFYVTEEAAQALIAASPSHAWRCTIALARFAGLRIPSELLALRWADIDFERRRMLVRSPKTQADAGQGERVVPIVPQLMAILTAAHLEAPDSAQSVVHGLDRGTNLRTTFGRIQEKAKLAAWPRPFHNMRASCATDLVEIHPAHVVAAWMGHGV
jgi:integrase